MLNPRTAQTDPGGWAYATLPKHSISKHQILPRQSLGPCIWSLEVRGSDCDFRFRRSCSPSHVAAAPAAAASSAHALHVLGVTAVDIVDRRLLVRIVGAGAEQQKREGCAESKRHRPPLPREHNESPAAQDHDLASA